MINTAIHSKQDQQNWQNNYTTHAQLVLIMQNGGSFFFSLIFNQLVTLRGVFKCETVSLKENRHKDHLIELLVIFALLRIKVFI